MLRTTVFTAATIMVTASLAVRSVADEEPTAANGTRIDEVTRAEPAGLPAGLWWADFDGDGFRDAYAVALDGKGHLLKNSGDGSFLDVTALSGLDTIEGPHLAVWHDFDGDGGIDLFVGTQAGASHLMHNGGDGTFQDVTVQSGITTTSRVLAAQVLDYDRDGLFDLYVRTAEGDRVYHALGSGTFQPVELGLPTRPVAPSNGPRIAGNPTASEEPAAPGDEAPRSSSTRSAGSSGGRRPVTVSDVPGSISSPPSSGGTADGSVGPFGFALPICADAIVDQTSTLCIEADSTPTLGKLYPLSVDFNVDPASGNVRVGTTGAVTSFRLESHGGGAFGEAAFRGVGTLGPTNGYAGVQGDTDFDGVPSADWAGQEIGIAGISTGGSFGDNRGVLGHSNGAGVRGEHSSNPAVDFGELGVIGGIGMRASGSNLAGDFIGAINVSGSANIGGPVGIGNTAPDEPLVVGAPLGVGWVIPAATIGDPATPGGGLSVGQGSGGYRVDIDATSTFSSTRIVSSSPGGYATGSIDFRASAGVTFDSPISDSGGNLVVSDNLEAIDLYTSAGNGVINCGGGIMNPNANVISDFTPTLVFATGDEDLYIGDDLEVASQGYKPGGGSWGVLSDRRLKRDIRPYQDGLDSVLKINPVWFRYKLDLDLPDDKEYVGVLAQDMQKVAPYTIEERDIFRVERETENGGVEVLDPGQRSLTHDPSALPYMLINAVKEQQQLIRELQLQNEDLRRRIEALER